MSLDVCIICNSRFDSSEEKRFEFESRLRSLLSCSKKKDQRKIYRLCYSCLKLLSDHCVAYLIKQLEGNNNEDKTGKA